MKMRKVLGFFTTVSLVISLSITGCSGSKTGTGAGNGTGTAAPGAPDDKKVVTLKYGTAEALGMPTARMSEWVTGELNKRGQGGLKVDLYGQSKLGQDAELMQQAISGTIEIVAMGTSAYSQYTPLLECMQLPFLLNTYEKEYAAFNSKEYKAIVAKVENQLGLKFLGAAENGLRHFANNVKPINSVADLKGMKIRIAPSTMLQNAMAALGANPTAMAYGEVFTALQNKVIDGEEINITSMAAQKHYEVVKYTSTIGMYPFPAVYVMNRKIYDKLSPEYQKLIADVFEEGKEKVFKEFVPEVEKTSLEACEKGGVKFNKIENVEEFRNIVLPIYDEYASKDPLIKDFIEMAKNLK